mmetsp:Transcript_39533/g.38017  ORF Transcript_39533/g.38017 Transcript_39533/m.38017 type:complete len:201 (+) Transcript_39533:874-1476(+)
MLFSGMEGGGDVSSYQTSGFLNFQSNMGSRLGMKMASTNNYHSNQTSANKTMSFEYQSHLVEKNQTQGRLDFPQFKKVMEILASKVIPSYPPTQGYVEFVKELIVPLSNNVNEKRCVHSKKIQHLLTMLDNQDMIDLLTLLHKAIIDIYKSYADNKGHMNFPRFINFCSDYDIFPHSATKATLYRIFHSLSFINELMGMS